jgi:hypothetical protein
MPCRISGQDHCLKTARSVPPRKKGSLSFPFQIWSGKRVSNSRPQPWQGCALPTELFPHSLISLTFPSVLISKPQIISLFLAVFDCKPKNSPTISIHNTVLACVRAAPEGPRHTVSSDRIWRRGPESNRTNRICNPGHNRFATAPEIHIPLTKKGSNCFPFCGNWSGKRVSNSRPQPWQGCALPTELFPHFTEASHCTTFAAME